MDVQGEVLGLSPDQFARWIAYFKVKRKEQARSSKKGNAGTSAPASNQKFRGR